MLVTIIPNIEYEKGKYPLLNSDLFPYRLLKKNAIFFSNSKGNYNFISTKKIGKGIEYIFNIETKSLEETLLETIPFNYQEAYIRVNEIKDILKEKEDMKSVYNSFLIVEEFINYCNEINATELKFIEGEINED